MKVTAIYRIDQKQIFALYANQDDENCFCKYNIEK